MQEKIYTQEEITAQLIPILKSDGKSYQKVKQVWARPATSGEKIVTITSDGVETSNTAKAGDYIIKNQTEAEEQYIIGGAKFHTRYELLEDREGLFSRYKATGKVIAIELTADFLKRQGLPQEFFFMAPWKEEMIAKKDDFLVCSLDYAEIYRIARKEFFETYRLMESTSEG